MSIEKEVDVCIIGSGAGGAPVAYSLGKAGFSVVVLEAGPRYDPMHYHMNTKDWEIHPYAFINPPDEKKKNLYTYATPEKLNPKYKHLRSGSKAFGFYNNSDRRKPPSISRAKGVGGTTLHYQGEAHRFSAHGFNEKSLYGYAEDWPISYKDLEPYYEKAEVFLGVSGLNGNPFKPPSGPFPNPPHELSCATKRVKVGFDKLGLHLWPNSLNIISKPYDGRPACNYCNGCYLGCMMRAKGSMDVTFIPKAEATGNVEIRPNSVVREITINKQGKVDSVIYFDSKKVERRQRAKIVVVSASALESPRLLLNSKSPLFPDGLANSSGMVGSFFMETLLYSVTVLFSEQINSYRGLQIDSRAWDYNEPRGENSFFGGVVFGVSALNLLGPLSYAKSVAPGWGSEHKDFMRKYFGHGVYVWAIGEQLPHEDNKITIDPEVKDYYGIPVAKVTTELNNNDLEMLSFMSKKCKEIVEAAGAEEIVIEFGSYDFSAISHMSGTCRMGNDPNKSVLNTFCQSHDVKNLFVIDSSCFVTEGGGDSPSLTIMAIALRASDYVISEAKKGNL
ncbi:MAG TPA: GMC family oxidoreductase [Thermodesulfobacteriota bacterium]|nr:GMC family oxidoreductase [Thermodesulfobacteriota bacterium]